MSKSVNHPSHYNSGKIEVIEAIEDWKLSFHLGNAVKYTARAGKKDPTKTIEDLEKAIWYLKREIERLQAAKEGREVKRPNDMNPRDVTPLPNHGGAGGFGPTTVTNTYEPLRKPKKKSNKEFS